MSCRIIWLHVLNILQAVLKIVLLHNASIQALMSLQLFLKVISLWRFNTERKSQICRKLVIYYPHRHSRHTDTRHKTEVCAGLPTSAQLSHFVPLKTSKKTDLFRFVKESSLACNKFINGRENLERSATRTFWQNHFGFTRHKKPLQFSSCRPIQKTH